MSRPSFARRTRPRRPAMDGGQALVLAIIVMLVMVIGATSVAGIIASNQTSSGRERQGIRAMSAGEAGLDLAANVASDSSFTGATCTSAVPCSKTVDGSTVSYWVTAGSGGAWTLNSKTTSPNGKVVQVLQETLQPNTTTTLGSVTSTVTTTVTTPPSPIWGYGFVMGGSPHTGNLTPDQVCQSPTALLPTTSFGGSGRITVPTWINGDVCVTGGSNPAIGNPSSGSTIGVHIGGSLYSDGGPTYAIGTSANPVASAGIITGCWVNFHGWKNVACDSSMNGGPNGNNGGAAVYASSFTPTIPSPTPAKPTVDESGEYNVAAPGPKNKTCDPGSTGTLPTFDNDSSPNVSLGTVNLITWLGSAFDCKIGSSELAWTPPAVHGQIGTLTIKNAVVFIDANITLGGADYIKLAQNSNGSIYADGYVQFTSDGSMCAYYSGTTCTPATDGWNPNTHPSDPIVFLAGINHNLVAQYGFDLENNSNFEGVAYADNGFYLSNSAELGGSVFADFGTVNGAGTFLLSNTVPTGAPGGGGVQSTTSTQTTTTSVTSTSSWNILQGSWRDCPTSGCS